MLLLLLLEVDATLANISFVALHAIQGVVHLCVVVFVWPSIREIENKLFGFYLSFVLAHDECFRQVHAKAYRRIEKKT